MSRLTTLVGINLSVSCCRKLLLQKPKPATIKEDDNNWLSYNSPGFCVCKPRKYHTICWEFDLLPGLFVSSWLIVSGDGVNGSDWCLAGGSWCWIKGLHQVPTVSSIFHHSWHFHVHYISSFISRILWLMCCYCKWWDWHECCWWFIYVWIWVKGQGVDIMFFLFFVMFLCCC